MIISKGNVIFAEQMNIRRLYTLGLFLCLIIAKAVAQTVSVVAYVEEENGVTSTEELTPGDQFTGSAPMRLRFTSTVSGVTDERVHYEWQIFESGNTSPLLTRFEQETRYDFTTSGSFSIVLKVTLTETDGNVIDLGETDPIQVTIAESELHIPNAFSPNDDGINDVFKVSYKSLVSFDACVLNRWGQKIYNWGFSNIDKGWDGTFHGKKVKDGVYFIIIKAVGSDGVKYLHKGDINVLTGFSGTGTTTP